MRILILGLNFSPELVGIGRYTGEMTDYLARQGHTIRVVTTPPYYPAWKVADGYKAWSYQVTSMDDVKAIRCPLWVPKNPANLKRLVHLFSFGLSSFPAALLQARWKPDVVICVIPTLFSAPAALAAARLCSAKTWLHIQDFELDAALNLGMLPGNNFFLSLARAFEQSVLARFDRVSTISENMLARVLEKGVPRDNVYLFPNWVNTRQIFPAQPKGPMRSELGIREDQKVVLYHGNLGRKQGLEILIEAAACLQNQRDILFIICGDGAARSDLEQQARDMKNVRFLDLQPESRLNELVNLPDIHALPQRAGAADLVMPSKLGTMLASGKPVVACAAEGTQIWKVINQVGKVVPPEDAPALAQAIMDLIDDVDERERLGKLGRNYTCQFLEKEVILDKFNQTLQELHLEE